MASGFDGIAFSCPAMGAETLEEDEFEPMFQAVELDECKALGVALA